MKASLIGFVSGIDEYTDKKTEVLVRRVSVATGGHMVKVRLEEGQEFKELDMVVVLGELSVYDRSLSIKGGAVRSAGPSDVAFFGRSVPTDTGTDVTKDFKANGAERTRISG